MAKRLTLSSEADANARDLLRSYEEAIGQRRKQVVRLEVALVEVRKMAREYAKGGRGRGEDHSLSAFRQIEVRARLALTESEALDFKAGGP